MTLSDILKTKDEVLEDGYQIDNNIIRGADISVIGHFNNAVSLNVYCETCCLIHARDNTRNLGDLIKGLVELFGLTDEDGFNFLKFKDIPCRIISNGWGTKVVGFGHFMLDKFVYTDDFVKLHGNKSANPPKDCLMCSNSYSADDAEGNQILCCLVRNHEVVDPEQPACKEFV